MRKGNGELTYKQVLDENRKLRKENEKLIKRFKQQNGRT